MSEFNYFVTIQPPTAVGSAVCVRLFSLEKMNLVVSRGHLLDVYEVNEVNEEDEEDLQIEPLSDVCERYRSSTNLIAKGLTVFARVVRLAACRRRGQRDALVVLTACGHIALIGWDSQHGHLVTLDKVELLGSSQNDTEGDSFLKVSPDGQAIVAVFYPGFLHYVTLDASHPYRLLEVNFLPIPDWDIQDIQFLRLSQFSSSSSAIQSLELAGIGGVFSSSLFQFTSCVFSAAVSSSDGGTSSSASASSSFSGFFSSSSSPSASSSTLQTFQSTRNKDYESQAITESPQRNLPTSQNAVSTEAARENHASTTPTFSNKVSNKYTHQLAVQSPNASSSAANALTKEEKKKPISCYSAGSSTPSKLFSKPKRKHSSRRGFEDDAGENWEAATAHSEHILCVSFNIQVPRMTVEASLDSFGGGISTGRREKGDGGKSSRKNHPDFADSSSEVSRIAFACLKRNKTTFVKEYIWLSESVSLRSYHARLLTLQCEDAEVPMIGVASDGTVSLFHRNIFGEILSFKTGISEVCGVCSLDEEEDSFLLSDDNGRLWLLHFTDKQKPLLPRSQYKENISNPSDFTHLTVELLGRYSVANSMIRINKNFVFLGARTGDSGLLLLLPNNLKGKKRKKGGFFSGDRGFHQIDEEEGAQCPSAYESSSLLEQSHIILIVAESENLGPIVDFCIADFENRGTKQIVACCGYGGSSTLKMIRNGIGLEVKASISARAIRNLWSLKKSFDSRESALLLISFISETKIMGFSEFSSKKPTFNEFQGARTHTERKKSSSCDSSSKNVQLKEKQIDNLLNRYSPSLWKRGGGIKRQETFFSEIFLDCFDCGNVPTLLCENLCIEENPSLIVQVTPREVRLICSESWSLVDAWRPENFEKLRISAVYGNYIAVVFAHKLLVLEVLPKGSLMFNGEVDLGEEVSNINTHEDIIVVVFWNRCGIKFFLLPSLLEVKTKTPTFESTEIRLEGGHVVSVILTCLMGVCYLFLGMGDGRVISYVIQKSWEVTEKVEGLMLASDSKQISSSFSSPASSTSSYSNSFPSSSYSFSRSGKRELDSSYVEFCSASHPPHLPEKRENTHKNVNSLENDVSNPSFDHRPYQSTHIIKDLRGASTHKENQDTRSLIVDASSRENHHLQGKARNAEMMNSQAKSIPKLENEAEGYYSEKCRISAASDAVGLRADSNIIDASSRVKMEENIRSANLEEEEEGEDYALKTRESLLKGRNHEFGRGSDPSDSLDTPANTRKPSIQYLQGVASERGVVCVADASRRITPRSSGLTSSLSLLEDSSKKWEFAENSSLLCKFEGSVKEGGEDNATATTITTNPPPRGGKQCLFTSSVSGGPKPTFIFPAFRSQKSQLEDDFSEVLPTSSQFIILSDRRSVEIGSQPIFLKELTHLVAEDDGDGFDDVFGEKFPAPSFEDEGGRHTEKGNEDSVFSASKKAPNHEQAAQYVEASADVIYGRSNSFRPSNHPCLRRDISAPRGGGVGKDALEWQSSKAEKTINLLHVYSENSILDAERKARDEDGGGIFDSHQPFTSNSKKKKKSMKNSGKSLRGTRSVPSSFISKQKNDRLFHSLTSSVPSLPLLKLGKRPNEEGDSCPPCIKGGSSSHESSSQAATTHQPLGFKLASRAKPRLYTKLIYVTGDRPATIHSNKRGQLQYISINTHQINKLCSFNHRNFTSGNAIAWTDDSTLYIGGIDDIQNIHVRSFPVDRTSDKVVYEEESRLLVVIAPEDSDMHTGNSMPQLVRFFNPTSFRIEQQFVLPENHTPSVVEVVRFSSIEDCCYVAVGTAVVLPGEIIPRRGQIILYRMKKSDGCTRIVKDCSSPVRGAVLQLAEFQGYLLAAINNEIFLYDLRDSNGSTAATSSSSTSLKDGNTLFSDTEKLSHLGGGDGGGDDATPCLSFSEVFTQRKMVIIAQRQCGNMISCFHTCNNTIVVGDLSISISVYRYDEKTQTIVPLCRGGRSIWIMSVACLTESLFLASDSSGNFVVFEMKSDAESSYGKDESTFYRLQASCVFHHGSTISIMKPGSIAVRNSVSSPKLQDYPLASNYRAQNEENSDDEQLIDNLRRDDETFASPRYQALKQHLWASTDGSIGAVMSLKRKSDFLRLEAIESSIVQVVESLGSFKHEKWRKPSSSSLKTMVSPTLFIDGDLVEYFLDLPRQVQKEIFEIVQIKSAESNFIGKFTSVEDLRDEIELLRRIH